MEQIKVIRLKVGIDLIGYVSELDSHRYRITKPMKIGIQIDPTNAQPYFTMQTWLPTQYIKTDFVDLWDNDIVFVSDTTINFEDYYLDTINKFDRINAGLEVIDNIKTIKDEEEIMKALDEMDNQIIH